MAGPLSGTGGSVVVDSTTVADVAEWTHTRAIDRHAYASSSTSGYRKRITGHKDCSGSFRVYLQDGDPDLGFDEGDEVTLVLYISTESSTTQSITGPAIIGDIEYNVPIEEGAPVYATVPYEGNGEWTYT